MSARKLAFLILICISTSGCTLFEPTEPRTYESESFSFQYPANWQSMSELWDDRYQPGKEYYQLNVIEIISITSVQQQGQSGAWFTVASTPLAGMIDLESVARKTYEPFLDDVQDYSETRITLGSVNAIEMQYKRPWGEPWWQFRDIWLVHDSTMYLLSFHALPESIAAFNADFEFILQNFTLK